MAIDEQKMEEAVGKVFGSWPLGAMAGETRIRQVLADAGYTRIRRVAAEAAPFNIVLEARP